MSVALTERSLFLHFVNREIQLVQDTVLDEADHCRLIKMCGLMSTGCLVAPFAQVHEMYRKKKNVNLLVSQLAGSGKLCLYSGSPDYPTFIESRQQLYAERRDRYSSYFEGKTEHYAQYSSSSSLDTTRHIKSTMLAAINPNLPSPNIFSRDEIIRLEAQSEFIKTELIEGKHAATFSLFEMQRVAPKPQESRFLGQMSCRLFVNHYADRHDLVVPTGLFSDPLIESYDQFPFFDIRFQKILLEKLGLAQVVEDTEFHQRAVNIMLDVDLGIFCRKREMLFRILTRVAGVDKLAPAAASLALVPLLSNLEFDQRRMPGPITALRMAQKVDDALRSAYIRDKRFAAAREKLEIMVEDVPRILLLTATPLEASVFRAQVIVAGYQSLGLTTFSEFTAACYRRKEGLELWHVQSAAGSSGLSGSARISEIAMREIHPKFVFSVGIAFGLDEKSQHAGDVFVAETIFQYERAKIENGDIQRRGDIIPCASTSFASMFSHIDESFLVIVGPVFSGDKLVNDSTFREQLRKLDPKAVGGEMEGAGIIQACEAQRPRFALIKGLADFGYNKNDKDQNSAAQNAFRVFFEMVESFHRAGTFVRI